MKINEGRNLFCQDMRQNTQHQEKHELLPGQKVEIVIYVSIFTKKTLLGV